MREAIVFCVLFSLSSPALAWGDREQGALIGFAVGTFLQQYSQSRQIPHSAQPAPLYVVPPYPAYVERAQPPMYRQRPIYAVRHVYDPYCRCYREEIIQID